jgi:hypothetical protein
MTSASQIFAKVRGKMKAAPAAQTPSAQVDNDEGHPLDLAALEAEHEAAQTAIENGDEWDGRDPSVIQAEMREAQNAVQLASELNSGTSNIVTRKEFEEFKTAVAVAFLGIEATLREPNVSPRRALNILRENAAAIGFSKAQTKALTDFERRADVVAKHYGDWDRRTRSQRDHAALRAAYMRPRGI